MRRPYVPLAVLLLVKIGGSVRGVYWDRWDFGHQRRVQVIKGMEKNMRELDAMGVNSWQIMTSDDFYPMYVQEYLIRKGREQQVILSRKAAEGDVIFVPDGLQMQLPLDGLDKKYVLWADDKLTFYGRRMRIYVLGSLVEKGR